MQYNGQVVKWDFPLSHQTLINQIKSVTDTIKILIVSVTNGASLSVKYLSSIS